jgi:hypothetical protein
MKQIQNHMIDVLLTSGTSPTASVDELACLAFPADSIRRFERSSRSKSQTAGETAEVCMNNMRDTFLELRGIFDGNDSFMRWGHQILKARVSKKRVPVPAWMRDTKTRGEFLLARFPRWNETCEGGCDYTDREELRFNCGCIPCRHHSQATLWNSVMHYCCSPVGLTSSAFASYWNQDHEYFHLKPAYVRRIIQMIGQAKAGKRLDGKPRSFGKPGRPSKPRSFGKLVRTRKSAAREDRGQ